LRARSHYGWAWDSGHPENRLSIEIRVNRRPLANVTAQKYRADLKHAGFGDGTYAFEYALDRQYPQSLRRYQLW
jgi:hypothetical protein